MTARDMAEGLSMAQWELSFRVDVKRVCEQRYPHDSHERDKVVVHHAKRILRGIAKLDPRPARAVFEDGCVKMNFVIAAEGLSEAHGQQSRIQDSLSKALNDTKLDDDYAIEYDPPQEVEAGTKCP